MDRAELVPSTARLPDVFADRVPESEREGLRSMAEGGEWGELLDLLVAILLQTRAKVSPAERDLLQDVLAGWGLPTSQLDALVVSH